MRVWGTLANDRCGKSTMFMHVFLSVLLHDFIGCYCDSFFFFDVEKLVYSDDFEFFFFRQFFPLSMI